MRTADIKRDTRETRIQLSLNLDGTGKADIASGGGFLDHLLALFALDWALGGPTFLTWAQLLGG